MTGAMIFEPHSLFGLNDPDGNPWPFGYVSEGVGRPIFELSVPALKPDDPSLLPLALKMTAATELFEALSVTHRLISDFAVSGFVDPDIGMRLYKNQGQIHAALAKARGK